MTATGVAATTFIQMQTPKDKLGRIMSLYSLIFRFAPAAGAVLIGLLADHFGLPFASLAMALLALIALVLYVARTKRVENRGAE